MSITYKQRQRMCELCEQIRQEQDFSKFIVLLEELNALLESAEQTGVRKPISREPSPVGATAA